jgi:hypothetical protein
MQIPRNKMSNPVNESRRSALFIISSMKTLPGLLDPIVCTTARMISYTAPAASIGSRSLNRLDSNSFGQAIISTHFVE